MNLFAVLLVVTAAAAGFLPHIVGAGRFSDLVGGILLIVSVFVHELGHGAALRRFGHVTGPMGIGLYLIYPVFYVEMMTLDALSKRGRLWVDIGGSHLQALFGHGVLCLGFALGLPWLVALALGIYAIAAFQLLPINHSDGYWLLLDMVEGVLDSRRVTWIRRVLNVLAGGLLAAVVATAFTHLWSGLARNHVALSAIGTDELTGLIEVGILLVLLFKFFLRRRAGGWVNSRRPDIAKKNGDTRDGTY